jgi:hypothetical protein
VKRKTLYWIGIPAIAVLLISAFIIHDSAVGQRGMTTEPAFSGRTMLNGQYEDGIEVHLWIGDNEYSTVSEYSSGIGHGCYGIGYARDTGDFCLKADTTISGTTLKDAADGIKDERGHWPGYDLNLRPGGSDCLGWD